MGTPGMGKTKQSAVDLSLEENYPDKIAAVLLYRDFPAKLQKSGTEKNLPFSIPITVQVQYHCEIVRSQ